MADRKEDDKLSRVDRGLVNMDDADKESTTWHH